MASAAASPARPTRAAPSGSGCTSRACGPAWTRCAILPTLVETVARGSPGAVLQVNGHRDVLEPTTARAATPRSPPTSATRAAAGDLELRVHDFLPDDASCGATSPRSTSPCCPTASARTRAGSRRVVTCAPPSSRPSCGYFAEQGPVLGYVHDEERLRRRQPCVAALTRAHAERPAARRAAWRSAGGSGGDRRCPRPRSTGRWSDERPLRICLVASSRFPVASPSPAGSRRITHAPGARGSSRRGHRGVAVRRARLRPRASVTELRRCAAVHAERRRPAPTRAAARSGWPSTTPTWA